MISHLRHSFSAIRAGAIWLGILAMAPGAVDAQEGLYGAGAPENAALMRVVNLNQTEHGPRIDVGPVRFSPQAPASASSYRPVPPGVYLLGGRALAVPFSPQADTFYTVLVHSPQEIEVVTDVAHGDPARAQLVLYNRTGRQVRLRAENPDGTVFPEVAPGTEAHRAVNAVSLTVVVDGPDGRPVLTRRLDLDRGGSYSIVLGVETAFVITAAVSSD